MNMTCEECHLRLGGESEIDDAVAEHLASCAACMSFYGNISRLDILFERALQADIDAVATHAHRNKKNMIHYAAIAACIVLIVGFLAVQRIVNLQQPSLPAQIIAHVAAEPAALTKPPGAAATEDVHRILGSANLRIRADRHATINYIMRCEFNGQQIVHMVVQDASGPVTVLMMTEAHTIRHTQHFHADGYRGLIEPTRQGAIVVLTTGGDVDAIARRIRFAFDFQTA